MDILAWAFRSSNIHYLSASGQVFQVNKVYPSLQIFFLSFCVFAKFLLGMLYLFYCTSSNATAKEVYFSTKIISIEKSCHSPVLIVLTNKTSIKFEIKISLCHILRLRKYFILRYSCKLLLHHYLIVWILV